MDFPKLCKRVETPMVLFQIIPDRSIRNNQNRLLWRLVHDLMGVDHGFRSRVWREGWTFCYRPRDNVWFDLTIRCREEEGETIREVIFTVAVPADLARTFKQKFLDKHPHVTVQEAPLSLVEVPEGSTITDYRYKRHDLFSLHCDDTKETSPLSGFLNAAYDLQGNDFARMSFCLERYDRQLWRNRADAAWRQLDQKRVPVRARFDIGLLFRNLSDIRKVLFTQFRSLIGDFLQAFQNSFFKSTKRFNKENPREQVSEDYARLFMNGDLSPNTKKKIFDSTFKTKIRLAVHCEDRSREHMIRGSFTSAMAEMAQDNTLEPHKVRVRIQARARDDMNLFRPGKKDPDPNIMSAKEIGKLNQYPTAELQERYADVLESKQRFEVELPAMFREPSGILLGHTAYKGEKIPVYLPMDHADTLMMPRVFIGSPRMGKDTALANYVVEAAQKGMGGVVLDVVNEEGNTRGLADSIRDALPPDRIIDLDVSNREHILYVGLNEVLTAGGEEAGTLLANDFAAIFEVEDNGRTRSYLREAVKACNGDPLAVRLLLLSEGTEGDLLDLTIKRLQKEGKHFAAAFWDSYRYESRGQKSEIRKPILNRLEEIFGDDHLKNVFGQRPNPEIDFARWLEEGKIILIRCPNNPIKLSEISVRTICQWLVLKTFYTKLILGNKSRYSLLVLNEPHQFLSAGLVKVLGRMLREAPKWRLSLLFAIHDFSPFTIPKEMVDALFSASVNWHVFKNTNLDVYKRMGHLLRPVYDPEEAMRQTPRWSCINLFFQNGEYQTPILMDTLPPVNVRNQPYDNAQLAQDHARRFGRNRKEVEEEIFEREKVLFKTKKAQ